MAYAVEILPTALKELDRLPPIVRQRLIQRVDALATQPRPSGIKRMVGDPGVFRLRVGEYRALYRIDDMAQRVIVERVGHRKDVYR